jgi:hypothetical protein
LRKSGQIAINSGLAHRRRFSVTPSPRVLQSPSFDVSFVDLVKR